MRRLTIPIKAGRHVSNPASASVPWRMRDNAICTHLYFLLFTLNGCSKNKKIYLLYRYANYPLKLSYSTADLSRLSNVIWRSHCILGSKLFLKIPQYLVVINVAYTFIFKFLVLLNYLFSSSKLSSSNVSITEFRFISIRVLVEVQAYATSQLYVSGDWRSGSGTVIVLCKRVVYKQTCSSCHLI